VTRFAHPSESELARLLDENGIPWMYEPHTFVLERGPDGAVVEAFTPDFFLPGANLYVELTTQRSGLGAKKRRKVQRAQERHGIVVVLHERRHFERLRRLYLYSQR
jgi:hypoxanthine phosphoribosyltransferase